MKTPMAGWARRRKVGTTLAGLGVILVLVGVGVLLPPVLGVLHRGSNDHKLLKSWLGPNGALTQVIPAQSENPAGSSSPATAPACGSGSPSSEFALLGFPSLPGIEGVAGNGNWSMLTQRSVVHYADSPGPGQAGNMLIAVHREPNFEPLGTLKVGDPIVVTNRSCRQFTYTITQIWVESPAQVTQLQALSGGSYLTVITCTPLWIDTSRIVIRAVLTRS
ncbi:MAG: class E sortase [Candidatus Dormibacteraeota bacterium]|nr:class E sortase [Candidatus Dormibacteraeota bacterium]